MKLFALALAILMLLSAGWASHDHHGEKASPKKLKTKLHEVRGKRGRLKEKLLKTKRRAHEVKLDINDVDARLSDVKARLAHTKQRLVDAKREQGVVAKRLKAANEELTHMRKQVRARIRRVYIEQQGLSGFSAVAGTRSAGELASRDWVMGAIERKDRELFNRYTELQGEVAEHKQRQDQLVKSVATLVKEQRSETRELADVRQEKGEALAGLRQQQGDLEGMLRQLDEDEARISSEIEAAARRSATVHRGGGQSYPAFTGRFSRPVDGPVTSSFGMRFHPVLHTMRMHEGVDFGAPEGTPVHAAADGDVIYAARMRGYGNVVIIDHGGGYSTVYGHNSRLYVSTGQHVRRGEVISAVGSTGLTSGPNLHFEVRINNHPVNPLGRL